MVDNIKDRIAEAQEVLKDGDTVWVVIREVSRSGASRQMDFYRIVDNELCMINYIMHGVLGFKYNHHNHMVIKGGGMDMVFWCVHRLSQELGINLKYRRI